MTVITMIATTHPEKLIPRITLPAEPLQNHPDKLIPSTSEVLRVDPSYLPTNLIDVRLKTNYLFLPSPYMS